MKLTKLAGTLDWIVICESWIGTHVLLAWYKEQNPLTTLTTLSINLLGETIDFNAQGETDFKLVVVDAETDEIIFE